MTALNANGGDVKNMTGIQQTVTLADNDFTVAAIKFTGSTSYIGDSALAAKDIVTDGHSGSTWLLKGTNKAQTGHFVFTNIGTVATSDSVQNDTSSAQTLVLTDAAGYSVAGITFNSSSVYIGAGSDTVDDNSTVDSGKDFDLIAAGQVTYKGYDFSQINRVETGAEVIDSLPAGGWTVDGTNIAKGGSITFAGVSSITTTQGVTNESTAGQAVTLNTSSLEVAGITFAGSKNYTGHSTKTDTVTDNTGTAGWGITGDNAATSYDNHVLANVSQITGSASVTNNTASGQAVTLNASSLEVAGITFAGSKNYTGHSAKTDTVTDNSSTSRWDLTGVNAVKSADNHVLVNISEISGSAAVENESGSTQSVTLDSLANSMTVAGIAFKGSQSYTGGSDNSDTVVDSQNGNWQVKGTNQADTGLFSFSQIGQVTTDGSVENASGSQQTVTLTANGLSVAGIQFINVEQYIGALSFTDIVIDSSNRAWTLAAANSLTGYGYSLTNVDQLETQGDITDSGGFNWARGSQTAYSDHYKMTVVNTSQISTTGSVNNEYIGNQSVTLNTNSLEVAGITFAGSKNYTGHSTKTDSVTDNTGTAGWGITGDNAATSDDNHVLANVSQITGSAAVSNDSNTGLSVTLTDDNLQAAGITFAGSKSYTGTSTANQTDSITDHNHQPGYEDLDGHRCRCRRRRYLYTQSGG